MYIFGFMSILLTDAIQLVTPQILGLVADRFQEGTMTVKFLVMYLSIIVGVALGVAVFRFCWRWFIIGTSRKLEFHFRNQFFAHLQKLSNNFYNHHKTGDLMAHATNDINSVRMAMGPGLINLFDAAFLSPTILIILFFINAKLTLFALIPMPFLAFLVAKFGRMIHKRFMSVQDSFAKLTDKVQENFSGIRVVKAFVQEKDEIDNFTKSNQHYFEQNMTLVKVWGLFHPMIEVLSALSFVVILGYGGRLVVLGDISLGDFVRFYSYLGLMTWPIMAIGWVINMFQRASASMQRVNLIFKEIPEVYDYPDTVAKKNVDGKIEFRNLSFRYSDHTPYVLRNINLTVEQGQTLAVIGRTGSGKTTLVNLLLRMYNPERGQLFIDEVDVNQIPLATIRQNVGYVPQDNFLFSTTITENIGFAVTEPVQLEIEEAAKIAQVYDNIVDFPDGFDTLLGERGVTLSGGQKQRVSIARALYKRPRILILDDSLSAVDTQTEEKILEGLPKVTEGITSIIIAHRISTIKNADHIIVLDDGKIIEEGTHDQLLTMNGFYNNLYQKQLLEEKLESA